jgi:excisionase family DNA binding protein
MSRIESGTIAGDLTDKEVAKLLRKHPRTVQRRCQAGKLPGAYKAGRSWRIPPRALRGAKLGEALIRDDVERELRAATLVCEQLRKEMEALKLGSDRLHPDPPSDGRNWPLVARELERLEGSLSGLAKLAARVPRHS